MIRDEGGASPARPVATATLVAPAARRWLAPSRTGRVLHVFDRVAYLIGDDESILLLAASGVGMGPFTLATHGLKAPLDTWLAAEVDVLVHAGRLDVGGVAIRIDRASSWRASPDWGSLRRNAALWRPCLGVLREVVGEGGRGSLFADFVRGEVLEVAPSIDSAMARAGRGAAGRLLDGLERGDESRLREAAEGLAGLGMGFTPAGDDFLMGTMFALWSSRPDHIARRFSEVIHQAAAGRTTRVSSAWLDAAARGEASEAWHELCDVMSRGCGEATIAAVRRILGTGHSSGEDALIGYVLGLETLAPGPK